MKPAVKVLKGKRYVKEVRVTICFTLFRGTGSDEDDTDFLTEDFAQKPAV